MNNEDRLSYIGHPSQLCGVEEVRLVGGKGDGMRIFKVRNAAGLELDVSADRCADISRLIYKGKSMSYFSPCGYVAPAYYDDKGDGWLKSFTAGFLTTCGISTVGVPCTDEGEECPLHGRIGNTPAERIWWDEDGDKIYIHAVVSESNIFSHKLLLERLITVGKYENCLRIDDLIKNLGDKSSPLAMLYHMNFGYPLLSESAEIQVKSTGMEARTDHAASGIKDWNKLQKPTPGYEEMCYYHSFSDKGEASVFNPELGAGVRLCFDAAELPMMTQWKMMGVRDYVLGLEPGNCRLEGRDVLRKNGELRFIEPGGTKHFGIDVEVFERP